jgi:MoxR-like ATPase
MTNPHLTATLAIAPVIAAIRADLEARFLGREEAVEAVTLGLFAGLHTVLLGVPGTGKSAIANALARDYVSNASWFRALLSMQTDESELFGLPVDPVGLVQNPPVIRRADAGKLQHAEVAFLDEVFKANSALLNSLLTLLNEREFDSVPAPLRVLFGASNELPAGIGGRRAMTGPDMGALWDRFHLRVKVDPIDNALRDKLRRLRGRPNAADTALVGAVTVAHLDDFREGVKAVAIPDEVFDALDEFESALETERVTVTDRRRANAADWVAARALLMGRDTASVHDLTVLQWTHWSTFDEIERVQEKLDQFRDPAVAAAATARDAVATAMADLRGLILSFRDNGVATHSPESELKQQLVKQAKKVRAFKDGQIAMLEGLRATTSDERVIDRTLDAIEADYLATKRLLQPVPRNR